MSKSLQNRVYGLDIIRATAILMVIYTHGQHFLPKKLWLPENLFFIFDGVNIFFVLSGFLIGTILIRTLEKEGSKPLSLLKFMYKRWFRTLPPYYLVLLIITLYYLVWNNFFPGFTLLEIRRYAVFVQNFNYPHPVFFSEAWSLAVEEWFYLIVPFSTFTLTRLFKPKHSILIIIISVIILVPCIRLYKIVPMDSINEWDQNIRSQVITRLDSIIYGLLGAYIYYYYREFWLEWRKPAFIIGLLLFFGVTATFLSIQKFGGFSGVYINVFALPISSIGVLLTMPYMNNIKQGYGWLAKVITFISLISYSLYLVNAAIVQGILIPNTIILFPKIPGLSLLLYLVYSFSLAALMYKFIEKPVMNLRDKLITIKKGNKIFKTV